MKRIKSKLALLRNTCFLALLNHALHLLRPLCVGVCANSGEKKKRTPTLSHVPTHRKHLFFCAMSQHRQDVVSDFSLKITAKTSNHESPHRSGHKRTEFCKKSNCSDCFSEHCFLLGRFIPFGVMGRVLEPVPASHGGGCTHEGVARSLQTELPPP